MKFTISSLALAILATTASAQNFNIAAFPPVNAVPPTNSPEVKEWLKGLSFADVPALTIHTGNPPACPALASIPADQCWWTCQTCPADDIQDCPNSGDWGITFDDGPSAFTPTVLASLKAANIKATFFVMGSNVVRNVDVMKQEVDEGHHIASHTWSHHPLTTLTNEQIVAELKWTEKAVFDITGLKMKYLRPPYGDVDNRVRAVVKKLGYIIVDWTSDAFDTKDFSLSTLTGAAQTTALDAGVTTFTNTLMTYGANPGPKGFITLEHDLYNVTAEFAHRIIPVAAQAKIKAMTVAQCHGDANPYQAGSIANNKDGSSTSGAKGTPTVIRNAGARTMSLGNGAMVATFLTVIGAALAL